MGRSAATAFVRNVRPVKLGETEKEFREAILSWFSTLKSIPMSSRLSRGHQDGMRSALQLKNDHQSVCE
ncbi:uncharacterized protein LOC142775787 isoform X3 [Rhipicephalus microplus]|uniref:uncharacterized protein LOC142775787 isoform X3 n=1 Tax=Rhipicephalus microplus TaxID=6941 RepID=UPI003F6B22EF